MIHSDFFIFNCCTLLMHKLKKMNDKKYHTVGTAPKSIKKIVERGKIGTTSTQIHERSVSWLSTGASINSVRAKLLLYAQPSHLSETIRSCKYFQLVRKCQPSHILGEQRYYKKSYNLEYYIIYLIFVTHKLSYIYNSSSIKQTQWVGYK